MAFIADTENNRIVAYDVATRQALGTFGSTGSQWNQFLKPQSIAVDPATGHILIADTENDRIKVVSTPDGIHYTTLNNVQRGFDHPEGVSIDAQGRIYVADSGNDRVVVLNGAFEITGIFTGDGFHHPAGVTVSGQDLYVSDTYNDTVDVFTWDVPVPDKPAPTVRTLAGPSVAAMYASGFQYDATSNTLVIADTGLDRILRYTVAGDKISEFGSPGTADGEFQSPRDVAVDGAGNIYVADAENNRIQKFDSAGVWQWTRGTTGSCSDCLFTPIGITWDAANQVVLVSSSRTGPDQGMGRERRLPVDLSRHRGRWPSRRGSRTRRPDLGLRLFEPSHQGVRRDGGRRLDDDAGVHARWPRRRRPELPLQHGVERDRAPGCTSPIRAPAASLSTTSLPVTGRSRPRGEVAAASILSRAPTRDR